MRNLRGWRSDRRAALVEIVVGTCVAAVGGIHSVWAAQETAVVLSDPNDYLIPKWLYVFERFAFGALHLMPALFLIAVAFLRPRRDPFTRPIIAASLALVLGSAHVQAVMSFFGAPLWVVGAVAVVVALRPDGVWAFVAAVGAAWTLAGGVPMLDGALRPGLLSSARGEGFVLDAARFRLPIALGVLGMALVVLALTLRRSSPEWSVRIRVGAVALLCFPFGAVAYWVLELCGLPLDA